jgi:hypothetical protein
LDFVAAVCGAIPIVKKKNQAVVVNITIRASFSILGIVRIIFWDCRDSTFLVALDNI